MLPATEDTSPLHPCKGEGTQKRKKMKTGTKTAVTFHFQLFIIPVASSIVLFVARPPALTLLFLHLHSQACKLPGRATVS